MIIKDMITSEGVVIVLYIVGVVWNTIYNIQYYKKMYPLKGDTEQDPS